MEDKSFKFFFATLAENKIKVEETIKILKPNDWRKILDFAKKTGLVAIFYHYLLNLKLTKSVPDKTIKELKNFELLNWQKNLIVGKEFEKLNLFFRRNKVKVLPVKGISSALLIYQNLHFRQAPVDFDFLIAKKDIAKTLSKLEKIGYQFHSANLRPLENILKERGEVLLFRKNSSNLDLHWWARNDSFSPCFGDYLLKNSPSLKNEDLAIFIAQSLAPEFESDFFQLKYLFDLNYLVKTKKINWKRMIKTAQKHDFTKILYFALKMSRYFFDTPLPEKYLTQIRPHFIEEKLLNKWINPRNILKYQKRKVDNYKFWYYIGINLLFSKNLIRAILIINQKIKRRIKNGR